MLTRSTIFLFMAWSVGALAEPLAEPLRGQEVNSDVKIPPPRELAAATPAISGMFIGASTLFAADGQRFGEVVTQASLGRLSEGETRDQLGDFMTSLLVRAGIVAFDSPRATLASSGEKSGDGSWPAWTGPTPMALSVSRTGRAASVRRR